MKLKKVDPQSLKPVFWSRDDQSDELYNKLKDYVDDYENMKRSEKIDSELMDQANFLLKEMPHYLEDAEGNSTNSGLIMHAIKRAVTAHEKEKQREEPKQHYYRSTFLDDSMPKRLAEFLIPMKQHKSYDDQGHETVATEHSQHKKTEQNVNILKGIIQLEERHWDLLNQLPVRTRLSHRDTKFSIDDRADYKVFGGKEDDSTSAIKDGEKMGWGGPSHRDIPKTAAVKVDKYTPTADIVNLPPTTRFHQ